MIMFWFTQEKKNCGSEIFCLELRWLLKDIKILTMIYEEFGYQIIFCEWNIEVMVFTLLLRLRERIGLQNLVLVGDILKMKCWI